MNNQFQDWNPLVFKREKTKKELIKAGQCESVRRDINNKNGNDIVIGKKNINDYDPENIDVPVVSNRDLCIALQKARQNKNITQSELDKMCNFPKNTVRDYENGSAIIHVAQIMKMNTALGVKLPRPVKKKI